MRKLTFPSMIEWQADTPERRAENDLIAVNFARILLSRRAEPKGQYWKESWLDAVVRIGRASREGLP